MLLRELVRAAYGVIEQLTLQLPRRALDDLEAAPDQERALELELGVSRRRVLIGPGWRLEPTSGPEGVGEAADGSSGHGAPLEP